jgi:hypothetical protein
VRWERTNILLGQRSLDLRRVVGRGLLSNKNGTAPHCPHGPPLPPRTVTKTYQNTQHRQTHTHTHKHKHRQTQTNTHTHIHTHTHTHHSHTHRALTTHANDVRNMPMPRQAKYQHARHCHSAPQQQQHSFNVSKSGRYSCVSNSLWKAISAASAS